MKTLFFDLETTGLDNKTCGIIQLGAIYIEITDESIKPIDVISLKMNILPSKIIDESALKINGITKEEISTFEDQNIAFNKFIEFLDKHVDKFNKFEKFKLVGYNSLHFDVDFLRQWFVDNNNNYFGSYFWSDSIDVFSQASMYLLNYRPFMKNFKLENVAKTLNIDTSKYSMHDALSDIKITFKIFKHIYESQFKILPFYEEDGKILYESQTC